MLQNVTQMRSLYVHNYWIIGEATGADEIWTEGGNRY